MVRAWTDAITLALDPVVDPDVYARGFRAVPECMDFVRRHVERRRSQPTDDLLGLMCKAEVVGDRLSLDELVATCILLFVAGFETTTNVAGNMFLAMSGNPEQRILLEARPDLVPNAVEETMRYDGTFRFMLRTATEDLALGGRTIRAGDPVYFLPCAANRDPAVFSDPDRFDVTRANAKSHLALGHGRHFCLGAGLARLELAILLERMLPIFPHLRIKDDELRWSKRLILRGLEALPVEIDRSRVEGVVNMESRRAPLLA